MFFAYLKHIYVLLLSLVNATKVYEFFEDATSEEISKVLIDIPVQEDDQLTFCFSHKQDQSNDHTKSMFAIFEDQNMTKHYMNVGFLVQNNALWIDFEKNLRYFLGNVDYETIHLYWLNICIMFSFVERKIFLSVNGEDILSSPSIESMHYIPRFYLAIGVVKKAVWSTGFFGMERLKLILLYLKIDRDGATENIEYEYQVNNSIIYKSKSN